MKNWVYLLGALGTSLIMVIYLLLVPPLFIAVPHSILTEWDSIWVKNLPTSFDIQKRCTAGNRILCSGSIDSLSGSKEFLGCVKVKRTIGHWSVVAWSAAKNMKRLPLAATGDCDSTYNAMWHIHPAVVDPRDETHLNFFKDLSSVDLETLMSSEIVKVSIMTWAPNNHTAAILWRNKLVYPVKVIPSTK